VNKLDLLVQSMFSRCCRADWILWQIELGKARLNLGPTSDHTANKLPKDIAEIMILLQLWVTIVDKGIL
jgi:hypothetical protein